MPKTKTPKKSFAERAQENRERLEAAVKELGSSQGWQDWLSVRAKFHHYSLYNQYLIATSKVCVKDGEGELVEVAEQATQVASFKKWQELDRKVLKGARSIRILAPHTYKRTEVDDSGEKREVKGIYFVAVPVFDIAQTEGKALPEAPEFIDPTGDSHDDLIEPLVELASQRGYSVRYEEMKGSKRGYCDPHAKIIGLRENSAANSYVRTLVHEIAHTYGINYTDYTRAEAEVIVESATYIVLSELGFDADSSSVPYITSWGQGDAKALKQYAATVDEVAQAIEEALSLRKPKEAS